MSFDDFLKSLKRFIAARGRPAELISDNGKTFVAAAEWIKKAKNNERVYEYRAEQEMRWQFNLSRASWWGGMFKGIVRIAKSSL